MTFIRRALPRLPPPVAFQDRNDPSRLWYLTHRSTDDRIALTDALPHKAVRGQTRVFEAFREPVIEFQPHRIRVFVRGGRLGYELIHTPGAQAAPLMSRSGFEKLAMQIVRGSQFRTDGDVLAWQDVEIET